MERWATFDCYGTLIDWNGGIGRELERLFGAARGGELLRAYHELEPQIQREDPSRSYREVMAVALARLGAPAAEQDALGRSLPAWDPFPEVPAALEEARARGWRLAVLSNTDRDLLDASLGADRRRVRAERRRVRDRLVQAGARPTGTSSSRGAEPTAITTSTSPPASSTTSRPRLRSACGRSGSTGSARRPSPSPTSSCTASTGLADSLELTRPVRIRPITPEDFPAIAHSSPRTRRECSDASLASAYPTSRPGSRVPTSRRTRGCSRRRRDLSRSAGSRSENDTGVAVGVVHHRWQRAWSRLEARRSQRGTAPRARGGAGPQRDPRTGRRRADAFDEPRLPRSAALLGNDDRARRRPPDGSRASGGSPDRAVLLRARAARSTPRSRRRSRTTGSISRSPSRTGGNGSSRCRTTILRSGSSYAHEETVVAATRNDPERSGGGWIGALGVRRAWRGQGLAKALLLHSFREFHRRGKRRVGLGVDSENPTGATKLYESVGMVVDTEQVVWEKVLA